MKKDYFYDVIGQETAKRKLTERLDTHLKNGAVIPHMLFLGSKGDGKSYMVRKFARHLPDPSSPERKYKKFISFNGGAIKSPRMFFEDICPEIMGEYATVFIDEAHDLPSKVETLLLTILEPRPEHRTTYRWDDTDFVFDFRKLTFIFATTEGHRVFHALSDRLDKIDLAQYTVSELGEVLKLHLKDKTEVHEDVISAMAGYIRRNARAAYLLSQDIIKRCVSSFGLDDWEDLKVALNLQDKGLTNHEISCLEILRDAPSEGLSLGMLSSKLAQPRNAVQQTIEPYLLNLGYMEIDGKRRITAKGREYLTKNGFSQKSD